MRQPIPTQKMEISADEIRYWRGEIEASKKRQQEEFVKRIGYDELVKYYEGIQVSDISKLSQMAIMNEMFPAISSIIRSVMYQLPTVSVTAEHPQAEEQVKPSLAFLYANPEWKSFSRVDLMKGSLQYFMKKSGFKEEFQIAAFDALVAGFVAIEVNHAVTGEETVATTDPQASPVPQNPLLEGAVGVMRNVMAPVKKMLGMTDQETEDKVAEETPQERTDKTDSTYVKRWSPMDILFDSKAVVFKESRHITKIVRMSLADFNAKYPHLKGKIQATSQSLEATPYRSSMGDTQKKSVVLYETEIKKKSGNCILVLADGIQEEVDYYQKPIETNDFSIKYGCVDKYGRIYPMSRARQAKKPQDDINHYLTVQFEHVDRAQRKIGVWIDGLGDGGDSALKSTDVFAFIPKKVPQAIFEALPAPQVVPENKEIIAAMMGSVNKLFGTTEIAKTGQSDNDLATQDVLEDKSFQANASALQDVLGDVAIQVLDGGKDIIMQLWDSKDYFKVTGISGGEFWYDPAMGPISDLLIGDYGISVDIQSAARPNPLKDRQDALELAKFITSGDIQMYLQIRGKTSNLAPIENVIKQYGQSPDVMLEDIQPAPTIPPGVPTPPPVAADPGLGAGSPSEVPQEVAA